MKAIVTVLALFLMLANYGYAQPNQKFSNNLHVFQPELTQPFPGVRDIAISSDGNEIYFTVESVKSQISAIVLTNKSGSNWSNPKIVSFSGNFRDIEPALSPDNKKLFFSSNRSDVTETTEPKDYDIWWVEMEDLKSKWSSPKAIDTLINSRGDEYYPSIANSQNLYFTAQLPNSKGKEDIFVSKFKNGSYSSPISLSDSINSAGYEFNAFVAPDESYIIFTGYGRADGMGGGDLYISYRHPQGDWGKSVNLGSSINSSKLDYCPFVDVMNNVLYFTSERTQVKIFYPQKLSMDDFVEEVNQMENGTSRIYFIKNFLPNAIGHPRSH